jgi:predicted transglutaminase-like cysteine proteinase
MIVALAFLLTLPVLAIAEPTALRPHMRTHGAGNAPHGFVAFCRAAADECRSKGPSRSMPLTAARLLELETVNQQVNGSILPMSDWDLYNEDERWTLPVEGGDCEDYALLKRKRLIDLGWPTAALLLTVVLDERGEGHAVLTARTSLGDVILDNKRPDVLIWHETGYHFVSRQSHRDPQKWVLLQPPDANPVPAWVAKVNPVLAEQMLDMLSP